MFWKGAFFAIGVIFETEVLVDLEEGLVVPGFFEEAGFLWSVAEETISGALDSLGGGTAGEFGVVGPMEIGILCETMGMENIGKKVLRSLLANEGDGFGCRGGREGVVAIPKLVGTAQEFVGELGKGIAGEFFESGPGGEEG